MIKTFAIILCASFTAFSQTIDSTKNSMPFPHNKISLSISTNVNNSVCISSSENKIAYKAMPGFGIGIEYFITKNERTNNTGIGVEYQFKNSIPELKGNYKNIPLYAFYDISFGKYSLKSIPKLSLKIGYNFLIVKDKFLGNKSASSNGIFYALGLSTQINERFMIRILYTLNQGKIIFNEKDYLFHNDKINIGIHFLF